MNNDDEGARLTRLEENRELIAKHRAEVSRSPAPSFAQRVAALEAEISNPGYVEHATEDIRDLIRAVREQQAALQGMMDINNSVTQGQERELRERNIPIARATLARWRIEP